jgi:hypothetical protein
MRLVHIPLAAAAFYVGLSISVAPAQPQNQPAGPAQAQQAPADPQDQKKPQQAGTEEPGSRPPAQNTEVFVNGKLAVPGAQDSQTVPAKFSKHNADIDALPTMAMPLGLTDEQKHTIAESVAKANAPVEAIDAELTQILPITTPVFDLPKDVAEKIPGADNLKAIRTKDKVLIVRPANMVVVDEIKN